MQLNQKILFICYTLFTGLMPRMCFYTYLWSAVIMFIWLTDGWCTSHSSLYTYWQRQTWNKNILWNQVYCTWRRHTTLFGSKCCHHHTVADLSYLNNYSPNNSPFVRQDDTSSSSLCHVQPPCSSRPQIGCLSNTECFDKWLSWTSPGSQRDVGL